MKFNIQLDVPEEKGKELAEGGTGITQSLHSAEL